LRIGLQTVTLLDPGGTSVIQRVAYGYRDHAYFVLKIRAAFPGVG